MINRALFQKRVEEKIKTLAFEAFVNEAFIRALPFEVDSLSDTSRKVLPQYVVSVVESLGGYNLLERAMQEERNPIKRVLLENINDVCLEAAATVSKRATDEHDYEFKRNDSSLEELVANTGFTDSEMKEFKEKADDVDVTRLADIIKDKVVNVLKDEKKSHERVEKINDELREVALGSDGAEEDKDSEEDDEKDDNEKDDDKDEEKDKKNKKDDSEDDDFDFGDMDDETEDDDKEDKKKDKKKDKDDEDDDEDEEDEDDDKDDDEDDKDDEKDKKKDKKKDDDDDEGDDEDKEEDDEKDDEKSKKDKDAEETVESFTRLILHNEKNEHKSFFFSIQSAACEQIIVSENLSELNPDELSLRRLKNLTFENTLQIFNHEITAEEALENLLAIQPASEQEGFKDHIDTVTEAASVDAIVVYTLLESLNTMNLVHPTMQDVRNAIESRSNMSKNGELNKKAFTQAIEAQLIEAKRQAFKNNSVAIESSIDSFIHMKDILAKCKEKILPDRVMESIDETIDLLKNKYEKMSVAEESAIEHIYDRRRFEGNVAQMLRVKTLLKAVHGATDIVFSAYPGEETVGVTIESVGTPGQTHVTLDGYDGSVDEFRRVLSESVLMESGIPPIYLSIKDGSGKRIKLK